MAEYTSPNKTNSQSREEYIQKTLAKVTKRPYFIGILSKLSEENKAYLVNLAKQFDKELEVSSSEPVASPPTGKKIAKDSFLYELELKLNAYDGCDNPTSIDTGFQEVIQILGNPICNEKIKQVHDKLIKYGTAAKIIDLVVCAARGKLYAEWKINNPAGNFYLTFNVSPRQGNRYVQYFSLVKKYFRLVVIIGGYCGKCVSRNVFAAGKSITAQSVFPAIFLLRENQ